MMEFVIEGLDKKYKRVLNRHITEVTEREEIDCCTVVIQCSTFKVEKAQVIVDGKIYHYITLFIDTYEYTIPVTEFYRIIIQ